MNTLLLTVLLLSPNQVSVNEQVQLEVNNNLKALQQQTKTELKKQLKINLDETELLLPLAVNPKVIAKNQTTNIKQLELD